MKNSLLTLASLAATSCWAAAQDAPPPLSATDKAAIEATLQRFGANLNNHQFSDMPGYTTPDISFINVVGMYWQGEPDVQRAHQAIFDRLYKGVAAVKPGGPPPPNDVTFRAITSDVVLVTTRTPMPARSDGPPPAGSPPAGSSMFTLLLVKRQGKWLITAGQNTPIVAQAAASNPIR